MASWDVNIVIASMQIELGVNLHATKLVEEVCDEGDQVSILLGDFVEIPEVHTELQATILFLAKWTGALAGDCDYQMNPLKSMSSMDSWRRPSSVPECV